MSKLLHSLTLFHMLYYVWFVLFTAKYSRDFSVLESQLQMSIDNEEMISNVFLLQNNEET